MNGSTELVHVDAVYHVPAVHTRHSGPWQSEADKIAWTDPLTGYACIIRRSARWGNLCGYIGVEPGHPLHGFDVKALAGIDLRVHGGINYTEPCARNESESISVCHVSPMVRTHGADGRAAPLFQNKAADKAVGHHDAWWLGFSCDKATDIIPDAGPVHRPDIDGVLERVYRDEAYVFAECTKLAAQLKTIEEGTMLRLDPAPISIVDGRVEKP